MQWLIHKFSILTRIFIYSTKFHKRIPQLAEFLKYNIKSSICSGIPTTRTSSKIVTAQDQIAPRRAGPFCQSHWMSSALSFQVPIPRTKKNYQRPPPPLSRGVVSSFQLFCFEKKRCKNWKCWSIRSLVRRTPCHPGDGNARNPFNLSGSCRTRTSLPLRSCSFVI